MQNQSRLLFCLLQLSSASVFAANLPITIEKNSSGGVAIKVEGRPFAEYVLDQANKPYLWPVHGPSGKVMTRAYPMQNIDGEQHDHPHHRGITFGHESIGAPGWTQGNSTFSGGSDTWAERKTFEADQTNPKKSEEALKRVAMLGSIKHVEFKELKVEGDKAIILEICEYLDPAQKRYMTEERRIVFSATPETRVIDFDQDFIATDNTVVFSDRKDAGLSIRVPTSLAVDSKQGGQIVNSEGITNNDAWAKPAKWCDYHGPVDGETVGVAMLNHPTSLHYPTRWHVRTYGLFTANPFAQKQFNKEQPESNVEITSGNRLKLRHRFILHTGDEKTAHIAEAFEAYSREAK